MDALKFTATAGDELWHVEVSCSTGMGGEHYFVMINNYYRGSIWKREGVWCGNYQLEQNLTWTDMQLLGERIEDAGLANC